MMVISLLPIVVAGFLPARRPPSRRKRDAAGRWHGARGSTNTFFAPIDEPGSCRSRQSSRRIGCGGDTAKPQHEAFWRRRRGCGGARCILAYPLVSLSTARTGRRRWTTTRGTKGRATAPPGKPHDRARPHRLGRHRRGRRQCRPLRRDRGGRGGRARADPGRRAEALSRRQLAPHPQLPLHASRPALGPDRQLRGRRVLRRPAARHRRQDRRGAGPHDDPHLGGVPALDGGAWRALPALAVGHAVAVAAPTPSSSAAARRW